MRNLKTFAVALVVAAVLAIVTVAFADGGQEPTTFNSLTTGAADTAVTASIAASGNQRAHAYSVTAYCSAGTAQVTVKDGVAGTVIFQTPAAAVGTSMWSFTWNTPLASSPAKGMDIVLGTCGAANTGTLIVQASRF